MYRHIRALAPNFTVVRHGRMQSSGGTPRKTGAEENVAHEAIAVGAAVIRATGAVHPASATGGLE